MNCRRNQRTINDPVLRKLTQQQKVLSAEVKELHEDLRLITRLIKSKESDLQAVNSTLIEKTLRGPFLSVVEPDINARLHTNTIANSEATIKPRLICHDGGK